MLMGFNLFSEYMRDIEDFETKRDLLYEVGIELSEDSIFEKIERDLINLIETCAVDHIEKKGVISWWMWENGFGKNQKPYVFHGDKYYLNTTADLWKFLTR